MRHHMKVLGLLLCLLAGSVACMPPTGPLDPSTEFEPPPSYRALWDELVDCLNFPYPSYLDEPITFHRVGDGDTFECRQLPDGCAGLYSYQDNIIYLAGGVIDKKETVPPRHEMGHGMIRLPGHSDPKWKTCGLMREYESANWSKHLL